MNGYRYSDAVELHDVLDHVNSVFVTAHVFGSTFGYAQDNRGLLCFASQQNGLDPFHVVDVELRDGIVAFVGLVDHFSS